MPQGAIVILFAIMLVAMAAGVVVINTMTEYKDRALFFSDEQINNAVGSYVDIEKVYGRAQGDKEVDFVYVYTKMRQDSDPLWFNTTLLVVHAGGLDNYYVYDRDINCSVNPNYYFGDDSLANSSNDDRFGVSLFQIEGDSNSEDFMVGADYAQFCVRLAEPMREAQPVRVKIVPESGAPSVLEFTSPELLPGEWIELYSKLI